MYNFTKRIFDIISSTVVCITLLPVLLPIIVLLKLTSEGEIFYFQERIGFKNKPFLIYKFATMLKDSHKMKGGYITVKNDSRLTFLGGFLRKTKINELPQLINIIIGNMSVVGPRPVMKVSFESYPKNIQSIIYNVKPGLTGIGSIVFRDEEEILTNIKNKGEDIWKFYKETIYPHKGELEVWYQNNKSLMLDTKLIFVTIWVIFNPESKIYEKIFRDLPKRKF